MLGAATFALLATLLVAMGGWHRASALLQCNPFNRSTIGFDNPMGGSWLSPENWNCGLVPCPGDTVSITQVRTGGPDGQRRKKTDARSARRSRQIVVMMSG